MILSAIKDAEKLANRFEKLLSDEGCFHNKNLDNIFQEMCFSLAAILAMCLQEKEINILTIPKEREEAFIAFYNGKVSFVVSQFINEINSFFKDFILLCEPEYFRKINAEISLFDTDERKKIIKKAKETFTNQLIRCDNPKDDYRSNIAERLQFYETSKKLIIELKREFPTNKIIADTETVIENESDINKILITPTESEKLDHRIHAIIYKYKAEAHYIDNIFKAKEIEREFGVKRKQAFYTIWNKKGRNYRPVNAKEFNIIIPLLRDFPNAQKAAINDLEKLNKSA